LTHPDSVSHRELNRHAEGRSSALSAPACSRHSRHQHAAQGSSTQGPLPGRRGEQGRTEQVGGMGTLRPSAPDAGVSLPNLAVHSCSPNPSLIKQSFTSCIGSMPATIAAACAVCRTPVCTCASTVSKECAVCRQECAVCRQECAHWQHATLCAECRHHTHLLRSPRTPAVTLCAVRGKQSLSLSLARARSLSLCASVHGSGCVQVC
jgi:hypothetical protein